MFSLMLLYRRGRSFATYPKPIITEKIAPQLGTMASKQEKLEFISVFPDIVTDLITTDGFEDNPKVAEYFGKVLRYNVPTGKQKRGHTVVATYKMLARPENLAPENIRLANILGWCAELFQAAYLINDDIVDSSKTRRDMPCWYTKDDVGMQAINDALMITNGLYVILKKYFSNLLCYVPIMEVFHEVTFKAAMGQSLDSMCAIKRNSRMNYFTEKTYKSLAKYKCSYPLFLLPINLGMRLADENDSEIHEQVKILLFEIGHFYQVENDIFDCFGDSEDTGKDSSDIREGKCTWLAVKALQQATLAQKIMFQENYGKISAECEKSIRDLYDELNLFNAYWVYKESSFNNVCSQIQQISTTGFPHELFFKFVESIYGWKC